MRKFFNRIDEYNPELYSGSQAFCWAILILLSMSAFFSACKGPGPIAVIVADTTDAPSPVLHGIQKLKDQLTRKHHDVLISESPAEIEGDLFLMAGLASGRNESVSRLESMKVDMPEGKEGFVIQKGTIQGSPMVVLCGSDVNGLMYALLDVARRIGLQDNHDDILGLVRNARERADLAERGISIYTMQRAWFEKRLYNEEYWKRYFDQLARSRINSFTVIFGYENGGFLAPPYPYFFDTEEFPEVKMANITPGQQRKNVASFNRMIELAHGRGISVTTGTWDHIYRGGVQDGGLASGEEGSEARVYGLNSGNLSVYTLKAFEKFLQVFPEIDRIQFRMHPESGLTREEMPAFWHKVFGLIAENHPGMSVDTRAKQLPDEIINDGIDQGLNIRVATKYWMEQMGLPFHPTHVNRQNMKDRRHGYADLLKYPQRYKVHWRLWNGGTTRILLWGDPGYCKRIAKSAHLYNGTSIEFNEPLATKMETRPHNQEPFELLNPACKYYDYEFERYWYFFDVFGYMSYSPDPPEALWNVEFKKRYGPVAGPHLRKGLHLASKVLPRIVASSYNYRYFPTTRGWAEKMHFGSLENFSDGGGTDIQQFVSFEEEARNILNNRDDPRMSVLNNSKWFASMADSILQRVKKAEEASGQTKNNEFISTITDLKILAGLSRYYSFRVKAAVHYNLYEISHNLLALNDAIENEEKAIGAWQGIVEAAGDVYTKDLMMGICRMNMCGHWETGLKQLKKEFKALKDLRQIKPGPKTFPSKNRDQDADAGPSDDADAGLASGRVTDSFADPVTASPAGRTAKDKTGPGASLERIVSAPTGKPLKITARVNDPSGIKWVRLRYRHVTQFEDYRTADMEFDRKKGIYSGDIPGSFIVPGWDIMYFIETMDNAGNGKQYPDFEIETPYVIVQLKR